MVDVTTQNFQEILCLVEKDLQEASFTCLDFEFSGLHTSNCHPISLFDTPPERYKLLCKSCQDFTVLQCGISIFCYDSVSRTYQSNTYNFFLFPRDFQSIRRQTYFESAASEFLMKFDFDFNKCFYGGITFLNEEEILSIQHNKKFKFEYTEDIVLNNVKSSFRQKKLDILEKWSSESRPGETIEIDCMTTGMLEVLKHDTLNKFDDLLPEILEGESSTFVVRKTTKESKAEYLEAMDVMINKKLHEAIGFTHIIRLMRKYKRPIVGHNLVLDIMYVYEKFFRPLPDSYDDFKLCVANEFPPIYDTRHIINNIKVEIKTDRKYKELLKGSSLLSLYNEVNHDGIKGIIYQPTVTDNMNEYCGMREHDAGYDSCLVGHVFIRLAHFYTYWNNNSPSIKPFHLQDYFREFSKFKNCLNLIRCDATHMNLDKSDPTTKRPQWLVVTCRDNSDIHEKQILNVFSAFGNVSVKKLTGKKCIVAMPSINMAAGLLVEMKDHAKFSVSRYNPQTSFLKKALLYAAFSSFAVIGGWVLCKSLNRINLGI